MLRVVSVSIAPFRNVRTATLVQTKPPYPFYFKSKGWRECGPLFKEIWQWPEKFSGWSVVPEWFPGKPEPSFEDDAKSQKTGYPDPQTNQFISVDDAKPELVVPDLEGFELKPYVSYRTSETDADAPPLTSRDLFDLFYADRITKLFKEGKYASGIDSLIEQEMEDEISRRKVLADKGLPVIDDGSIH